jgi:hypothetical protein
MVKSSNPLLFPSSFREWNFVNITCSLCEEEDESRQIPKRTRLRKKGRRIIKSLSQIIFSEKDDIESIFGLRKEDKSYQILIHKSATYIENSSWITIDTNPREIIHLKSFLESVLKCADNLKKEKAIEVVWKISQ